MKIDLIRMEGFRGFRESLEIPCGSGFTVICGPNGSGKSTICDSLEFVLRGSLLFREGTERGEYISNYLWWRGEKLAASNSVAIRFRDSERDAFTLSRALNLEPDTNLRNRLINPKISPSDWVLELCLTTIVRDEAITILSTDRPERERYEFALQAMGLASSVIVESKVMDVISTLDILRSEATKAYELKRKQVEGFTSELSQARIAATKASQESIEKVSRIYSQYLDQAPLGLPNFAGVIATRLAQLRERIGRLDRLQVEKSRLDKELGELQTEVYRKRLAELESQLSTIQARLKEATAKYEESRRKLEQAKGKSPFLTSLALLREHGSKVGLQDGRCPLCGLQISPEDFERHLREIDQEVSHSNEDLAGSVKAENEVRSELNRARSAFENTDRNYQELKSRSEELSRQMASLVPQALQLGVELSVESLAAEIENCSKELSSRSEELSIVEAYANIHRVTELEEFLKGSRQAAEGAEKDLSRVSKDKDLAVEIKDAANRVSREIVRERLATLKPLFLELCERLRPHPEWREIDFLLRGDVMPFLSFVAGNGLNPRFVFSSGQRRALGLAFLLTVHLSRTWCKLETLILDDPVQHIDDYRALHLVETLAALRMSGRQIICTVEDPALADLLCRRLRTKGGSEGVRVDLIFRPGDGVQIKDIRSIDPLPTKVLAAD